MIDNSDIEKIINLVFKAAKVLPPPARDTVNKELENLKEMLMENRPPRVLVLGRRGAGKSSIVNALFKSRVAPVGSVLSETGKAEWFTFNNQQGSIEILDTRGIGDRTKPESANFENAIDEILVAIKDICPDIILFLCKAKEVDSHITSDLANVNTIQESISKTHKYKIPIVALVTQVDELDPKRVEPPYDNPIKQQNIKKAVSTLQEAYSQWGIDLLKVIPVSAYAEYEDEKMIYNNYWNIEKLVTYLIEHLPKSAKLQLARLSKIRQVQTKLARTVITSTSAICGALAATPIPVGDIFPITAAQVSMIMGIGYISGRDLSKRTAKEFFTALGLNVGAGFALREIARAAVKFIFPGGGNVISAGVAVAATWGIGEAAISYFIQGKSINEAKSNMKKAQKEKEESKASN